MFGLPKHGGRRRSLQAAHRPECDAHEIADARFFPNERVAHGAAIDVEGADLDAVVNYDPANPQRPGKSVRGQGDAGMAEIDTWLKDNPVAEQRVGNRHLRPDQAIAADADIRTDDAVRAKLEPEPISARGPMTTAGSTITTCSRRASG